MRTARVHRRIVVAEGDESTSDAVHYSLYIARVALTNSASAVVSWNRRAQYECGAFLSVLRGNLGGTQW